MADTALTAAASAATATATRWAGALTDEDHATLATAFYRAESLAHAALEQALAQVSEPYRAELREQIADEARHVAVFAGWHAEAPEPVPAPKPRPRGEPIWFTTLLLNEIAGFCQFHMLAGLVGDAVKEADVRVVAGEEIAHIERLTRWLEPTRKTKEWATVRAMADRFVARLESRMMQFLPSSQLAELRTEMGRITETLIEELL